MHASGPDSLHSIMRAPRRDRSLRQRYAGAALGKTANGPQGPQGTSGTVPPNILALASFVSVDPNPENGVAGPNIVFTGANVHIVSGSGATTDNGNSTGLGNLIIGYDEVDPNNPLNPGDRAVHIT